MNAFTLLLFVTRLAAAGPSEVCANRVLGDRWTCAASEDCTTELPVASNEPAIVGWLVEIPPSSKGDSVSPTDVEVEACTASGNCLALTSTTNPDPLTYFLGPSVTPSSAGQAWGYVVVSAPCAVAGRLAQPTLVAMEWRQYTAEWVVLNTLVPAQQAAIDDLEIEVERVASVMGTSPWSRIAYFLYPSEPVKRALTGIPGNGHAEGNAVHTVWPADGHEIAHVLASAWGRPTPFLSEGLAVWASGAWHGRPLRESGMFADGEQYAVGDILSRRRFRRRESSRAYAIAGAFILWAHGRGGLPLLHALYQTPRQKGRRSQIRAMESALEMPMEEIQREFANWLRNRAL